HRVPGRHRQDRSFLHHWRPVRVRDAGPGHLPALVFTRDFSRRVDAPLHPPLTGLFPSPARCCYKSARGGRLVSNSIERIRTIALVGQSGAGKTTLAEALLARAGAIPAAGSVERGTTVCDYTPLEKQLQHSLKLAVASFDAKTNGEATRINLPAADRKKVSDCFFAPSGEADFSSVDEAHRKLVDQVVEVDEKLMEAYLEKGEVTPEELHAPLERALREGHLIPVVFASAKTG